MGWADAVGCYSNLSSKNRREYPHAATSTEEPTLQISKSRHWGNTYFLLLKKKPKTNPTKTPATHTKKPQQNTKKTQQKTQAQNNHLPPPNQQEINQTSQLKNNVQIVLRKIHIHYPVKEKSSFRCFRKAYGIICYDI